MPETYESMKDNKDEKTTKTTDSFIIVAPLYDNLQTQWPVAETLSSDAATGRLHVAFAL